MKTFLAAAFLILLALIWFHRDRVFLRDPIASVSLDGIPQTGVQVFINGSNDVLIERDATPDPYRLLIQHTNPIPGTPTILRCIRWMACLTEANPAETIPLATSPHATMTGRETSYTTPGNARIRITLR